MDRQTFGSVIVTLRKKNGLTQMELAEKMGVTDKAVSKWERDLSFPDISSLPKLAEIFHVTVDELMQGKIDAERNKSDNKIYKIAVLALKGVALAMGIAVTVLSSLKEISTDSAVSMLGIGLACLAMNQLMDKKE